MGKYGVKVQAPGTSSKKFKWILSAIGIIKLYTRGDMSTRVQILKGIPPRRVFTGRGAGIEKCPSTLSMSALDEDAFYISFLIDSKCSELCVCSSSSK